MSDRFIDPCVNLTTDPHSREEAIRTLLDLVQFHLTHNKRHLFCVQAEFSPKSHAYEFIEVTFERLGQALGRCQEWLQTNTTGGLSPPGVGYGLAKTKASPVALFLESNIGLVVHILALMGLGVPVLLLSTRLSPGAISHLLHATGVETAIVSAQLLSTFSEALNLLKDRGKDANEPGSLDCQHHNIAVHVPEAYQIFLATPAEPPAAATRVEVHPQHYQSETDRDVVILHSSGTSGLPKPIYCSHRHFLGFAVCHCSTTKENQHGLSISTSPFFHGFGMVPVCLSLGIGKPFCIPPPSEPSTGSSVTALIEASSARSLLTVPSILEEAVSVPGNRGIQALLGLDFVAIGGGLPKASVGHELDAARVKLINHYGATETGPLSPFFVPPHGHDWHYFRLRQDTWNVLDVRMDIQDDCDATDTAYRLSMRPFGWQERFVLQDLLRPKPGSDLEDLRSVEWTVSGRKDDLICLSTGEKVRPTILEAAACQCPGVKAAVALGDGAFELSLIVEPDGHVDETDKQSLRARVWTSIQDVSRDMDTHARITSPAAVMVVESGSLPRSDKGTILRRQVNLKFSQEIRELYEALESGTGASLFDFSSPRASIRSVIETVVEWRDPSVVLSDTDDFFALGMDSLQAVRLRRSLLAAIERTRQRNLSECPEETSLLLDGGALSPDIIYRNPTVTMLANALSHDLVSSTSRSLPASAVNEAVEHEKKLVAELVDRYSGRRPAHQGHVIVLTGSTGSLGSFLLARLAADPCVARVICMIRPSRVNAMQRQREALSQRCLSLKAEDWLKVSVLATSTGQPRLGLGEAEYENLLSPRPVSSIVHVAWPMNFNQQLASYEDSFKTLQNLLRLATDAHASNPVLRPRLLFASSISTVGNFHSRDQSKDEKGSIPEAPVGYDSTLALGYAKAKLVCEHIIGAAAVDHPQVEAGYIRIGQIAGARCQGGYWNKDEHFVALVASSARIGKFPQLHGTLSWLPVDCAAASIAEILFNPQPLHLVYHLENPSRQSWENMTELFTKKLSLESVPFAQWLKLVVSSPSAGNPAQGLLHFFQSEFLKMSCGEVTLDTSISRDVSPTLSGLTQIGDEEVGAYLKYWRSVAALG